MLRKSISALFVVTVCTLCVSAQKITTDKKSQDKALQKHRNDSTRKANTTMKPTIGIGPGIFHFMGDVNHNKSTNPMIPSFGFNLNVAQFISPSFCVDFDFVMGNMVANEQGLERNLNFKSRTINGSVQITYNFAGMLRPDRIMNPYIGVGVGVLNFDSKGDITDANGNTYNYWNDGTIRTEEQYSLQAENAIEIQRDYEYETDLRQANLDSLGKYSQVAFTVPVSFGFDFIVSPRMRVKLGSTYYFAFTDLIDNVSADGSGIRKGDDKNDNYFFTNFTLHYDFFSPKKKAPPTVFDNIDFTNVVENDSDGDGIPEELDKCPDTPKGTKADQNGCPLDSDGDGIPDYADMEANTAKGMKVDVQGYGLTDDAISGSYEDTIGTNRAKMFEIFPAMREIYPAPDKQENR